MTELQRPKTPVIVYLLALLVVLAIWMLWNQKRASSGEQLQRWTQVTLSPDQIAENLASEQVDDIGHGLVQLQLRLTSDKNPEDSWLKTIEPLTMKLGQHEDSMVKMYVAYALAYWPGKGEEQEKLLVDLLQDGNGKVSINAAFALAARKNDAGAEVIKEAIENTKGEQQDVRRNLLANFRHVAGKQHRAFLEEELRLAKLDHDDERAKYCEQALQRIDSKEGN